MRSSSGLTTRMAALALGEHALILGAVVMSIWLRLGDRTALVLTVEHGMAKAFLIAFACQICLYFADLYDLRSITDRRELFTRLVQSLGATSFILAALYFWFPALMIGRGVFLIASLLVIAIVAGWRLTFEWVNRAVAPRERLLIVGTNNAALVLARELFERRQELGVEIAGFIDPDPDRVGAPVLNPGVIGAIDDIPAIVRANKVDRVVVSLSDARGKLPMEKLLEMKLGGVTFDHLASVYEEYTGKIAVENLRPSWLIFSSGFKKAPVLGVLKRAGDVGIATLGLVLASPLMALVALSLALTSRGPVFYQQQRVGRQGRTFTLHKFRSMRQDAEAATGAVWASKDGDPRITPVGRFLRATRLDELPQLWNILIGDMSFVGPRPERPEFVHQLTEAIPYYGQRHVVRPGLTGWAQVKDAYGASVEDSMEKLQYDLFYIKNMSIALDLFICLSTVKTVVLRKGT